MEQKIFIAIGVLALLTVLYLYLYPELTQTFKPIELENAVITLERTACHGFCPVYKLTVYGDGRVVYEGRSFVKVRGVQNSKIAQGKIEKLIDEFYRIGYFSLQDRYEALVSDLPTKTTSITIGDRTKTIVNYYGAPQGLNELENRIDEITNSKVWIGKCAPKSNEIICE